MFKAERWLDLAFFGQQPALFWTARVTIRPLLTAEEMDKAVEKWPPSAFRKNKTRHSFHKVSPKALGAAPGLAFVLCVSAAPNRAAGPRVGQLVICAVRTGAGGKSRPVACPWREANIVSSKAKMVRVGTLPAFARKRI